MSPKSSSAPAAASSGLKADEIFLLCTNFLASGDGKDLINQVGARYGFEITAKKGGPVLGVWDIDLKNGQGSCTKQKPTGDVDATFTMTDGDLYLVFQGELNPQMAFMEGKMKIKGNMAKASKFTPELFPEPTPENFAKYSKAKL